MVFEGYFFRTILIALWTCSLVAAQGEPAQRKRLRQEPFRDFLLEFVDNPEFQRERIVFPLPSVTFNPATGKSDSTLIRREDWKYNEFAIFRTEFQVRIYDNFSRTLRESDERVLSVEGNGNGINYGYFFQRREGRWFLLRILDEST